MKDAVLVLAIVGMVLFALFVWVPLRLAGAAARWLENLLDA